MADAVQLYRKHSIEELLAMQEEIKTDPANQTTGGLYLLTPKARKKLDVLGWAIYYHLKDKKSKE